MMEQETRNHYLGFGAHSKFSGYIGVYTLIMEREKHHIALSVWLCKVLCQRGGFLEPRGLGFGVCLQRLGASPEAINPSMPQTMQSPLSR